MRTDSLESTAKIYNSQQEEISRLREAINRYRQFFAHMSFVLKGLRLLVNNTDIPKELGVNAIDELDSWNPKRIEAMEATP